ncbi:MAG: class I adenylate-forming enzyme family protein [Rhodospirillales bacterium]
MAVQQDGAHPGVLHMQKLRANLEAETLPDSLGALVRSAAEAQGDKTLANWFEDGESLTYRQFDETVDRLASSLVAAGVRKGTHVAVMLPNVPAFPISWVALGRIGAVMVPVNTAYRSDELFFVLNDSDAQFLIVDAAFLPVFQAIEEPLPLLAAARVVLHGEAREGYAHWQSLATEGALPFDPPSAVSRGDLLNIQYTSGTTGFPKGCMLSHDYWMIIGHYAARFRESDGEIRNSLIWAPFFYMDAQWQFLMTMILGATAHVARRISLSRFYDWLEDFEINYCIFPEPALKHRPPSEADRRVKLSYVSIYGWRVESRREVMERFGVVAREGYGMTEIGGATIVPTIAEDKALLPTCGLPGPFRALKIVDEAGREVTEPETTGELWVSGRSLLWGYYKRPEANAESFRGRWFRTGDIFKRDADGFYYIVGRIKDMVRRSGENIAAREVEAAIATLEAVAEAAVVPVPDPLRREEVKVYLLLREGLTRADCPPEQVIAHCERHLADFKIPRYIAYMSEDFPRTPSRKIQKKNLMAQLDDLRQGAYDREAGSWR